MALRLARADQAAFEIGRLSLEWSRADGNGPLTLHQVENPPGTLSLVVTKVRPIAPAVSMLFSEAVHHLRAAIDNTIFSMVGKAHRTLDDRLARRVAMPIFDEASKLDRWLRENEKAGLTVLGAASSLAPRIRALQPFASDDAVPSISKSLASLMGVDVVREHPLFLLQGYSNEDKHRAIRTAAARTLIQRDDESFFDSDRRMRPVEPGDVLSTVPKGELVMVDSNAAVHVERPGSTAWVSPGHELDHLRAYVANVAIPILATGLAISAAFPPEIDLSDTGHTARERIDAGSWQSAHQRMMRISYEALSDALNAQPTVPPIFQPDIETSKGT